MSGFITDGALYIHNYRMSQFVPVAFGGTAVSVSVYGNSIGVVDNNGDLWMRGDSADMLGLTPSGTVFDLTKVPLDFKVAKVMCAPTYTAIIGVNGKIRYSGRLGRRNSPGRFSKLTKKYMGVFVDMSYECLDGNFGSNILAVDSKGDLWGEGPNENFVLGGENDIIDGIGFWQQPVPPVGFRGKFSKIQEGMQFVTVNAFIGKCVCIDIYGQAWGCGKFLYELFGWEGNPWEFKKILEGTIVKAAVCGLLGVHILTIEGRLLECLYISEQREEDGNEFYQNTFDVIREGPDKTPENTAINEIAYTNLFVLYFVDTNGNLWVGSSREISRYYMVPGANISTLPDQKSTSILSRRYMRTKAAK